MRLFIIENGFRLQIYKKKREPLLSIFNKMKVPTVNFRQKCRNFGGSEARGSEDDTYGKENVTWKKVVTRH